MGKKDNRHIKHLHRQYIENVQAVGKHFMRNYCKRGIIVTQCLDPIETAKHITSCYPRQMREYCKSSGSPTDKEVSMNKSENYIVNHYQTNIFNQSQNQNNDKSVGYEIHQES